MQCFAFLSAGPNFSFFCVCRFTKLLTAQRFQIKSLRCFAWFFSHTLAYDTMPVSFDFVSIWQCKDEYIEYFFQEKCSHGSFTCMLQHSKPTKSRANLVLKYKIHRRLHTATSSPQALDIWSDIFYTCRYWSVKQTRAPTPLSQWCGSPLPLPPCLTSPSPPHEGRGCSASWRHWLGSVCYRRHFLAQRWFVGDETIIVCYQVRHQWAMLIVVSLFLPRTTVKTSSKVFFPTVLVELLQ